jgi:hypothetical protein
MMQLIKMRCPSKINSSPIREKYSTVYLPQKNFDQGKPIKMKG